jgi:hypothetical protein
VHDNYRKQAEIKGWTIKPDLKMPYPELAPDFKASNRAAALRIPELLELINYVVLPKGTKPAGDWRAPLEKAIANHIDRLGMAEHLGWEDERRSNGWIAGKPRDDARKIHHALVEWSKLAAEDQEKDRDNVRYIPEILNLAGYYAELVRSDSASSAVSDAKG